MRIIAEIGWNFMGDMNLASKMIGAAQLCGADYVKTQVFNESRLKPGPWDTDGRREIYKKAQLDYNGLIKMQKLCQEQGIGFLASPMSVEDAKVYAQVTNDIIKIPGFESRNKELVDFAYNNFNKIIMSTGTSTITEIEHMLKSYDMNKFVLMHCVSSYPCLPENANLPRLNDIKNLLIQNGVKNISKHLGYSDHIQGINAVKVAMEYDIGWVEKHFTTDQSLPGRDNKFAILPGDLIDLVNYLNQRKQMKINHGSGYLECETETRKIQTGRFNG